ncbi:MAG: protein kinase [Acidobacteriia bacterium]|nr:protein kinase [Terriglobia bacterium]
MLNPGTKLGPYTISEKIGSGGMGEVYLARDAKLDRDIALKVLPDEFASDPERLGRFEREAKTLASLTHPNIAALYGIEDSGSIHALVMELVEGPTLAERIHQGAIPLDEALPIAREIAGALEYAHERGIIHRDLKPANVKITPEGRVKVLDFGLAKAVEDESSSTDASKSPTMTHLATRAGFILGTAAYMSPEQAKGKAVDRRSDVWSFGCVLFEMLTGRQTFEGDTASETLAAVLRGEPDWALLPRNTPAEIRRLLERCLRKEAKSRLQSIGDARIILEDLATNRESGENFASTEITTRPHWKQIAVWAAPALLAGLLLMWGWMSLRTPRVEPPPVQRLMLTGIPSTLTSEAAISPDGQLIAYTTGGREATSSGIYLRPMESFESKLLSGTESARSPFYSTDGKWIGYVSDQGLMKIPVSGGAPQFICPASTDAEGAWGPDGTIVLSYGVREGKTWPGLLRVSSAGGEPQVLTTLDLGDRERLHSQPGFLPGGDRVLFTIRTDNAYRVDVVSLRSGERRTILQNASAAKYSPTGHLLYQAQPGPDLAAVSFDPSHMKITGAPVILMSGLESGTFAGKMAYDLAGNGTLIYSLGAVSYQSRTVVWVNRKGEVTPVFNKVGTWAQPRISPDGSRLLLREVKTDCDLWTFDFSRQVLTRLTFDSDNHDPVWTPDGRAVTYVIPAGSPLGVVSKPADGSGPPSVLFPNSREFSRMSWSADGHLLALTKHGNSNDEIWIYSKDDAAGAKPFIQGRFNADNPHFSPDGRFLVYSSDESGRTEVYLRPYPNQGGITQISNDGGDDPLWSHDGKELFYLSKGRLMEVSVRTQPQLSVSKPIALFQGTLLDDIGTEYDVAPDGKRFVIIRPPESRPGPELLVVLNYFSELKRLAPGGQ